MADLASASGIQTDEQILVAELKSGSEQAFALLIALHEASNQRRWWGRHKRQELTIDAPQENEEGETFCLADALAATDASPYDCAARAELKHRVQAALQEIPAAFREVVVLREIEGFGYEEIAEILNVNLGTVKSRLTRGRAALREALNKDGLAGKLGGKPSVAPQTGTMELVL